MASEWMQPMSTLCTYTRPKSGGGLGDATAGKVLDELGKLEEIKK